MPAWENVPYVLCHTVLVLSMLALFSPLDLNRGKLEIDSKSWWQDQTVQSWTEVLSSYTGLCMCLVDWYSVQSREVNGNIIQ